MNARRQVGAAEVVRDDRSYYGTSTLCREQILRSGQLGLHITHCYLKECPLIEIERRFRLRHNQVYWSARRGWGVVYLASRIIILGEWWHVRSMVCSSRRQSALCGKECPGGNP